MQEEWAVVIVDARLFESRACTHAVAICEVSQADSQPLTLCADQDEAQRIAEVVCTQLHLPMYDGADPFPDAVDAGQYVDLDADGPDPYGQYRNAAQVR